jgi:hypothetical protein
MAAVLAHLAVPVNGNEPLVRRGRFLSTTFPVDMYAAGARRGLQPPLVAACLPRLPPA